MDFGKRIITESYFNNKLVKAPITYSIPVRIQTQGQALSEIMKALEVFSDRTVTELNLKIDTDVKTGKVRMITKSYTVPK